MALPQPLETYSIGTHALLRVGCGKCYFSNAYLPTYLFEYIPIRNEKATPGTPLPLPTATATYVPFPCMRWFFRIRLVLVTYLPILVFRFILFRFSFTPATFYGAGSEMANTSNASAERGGGGGGGGGHRVIYCVHGKPEGCCARVLSESNSLNGSSAVLPSPPITLCKYLHIPTNTSRYLLILVSTRKS